MVTKNFFKTCNSIMQLFMLNGITLFLNFSCFTFQKKYGQADEDCRHGMLISFFITQCYELQSVVWIFKTDAQICQFAKVVFFLFKIMYLLCNTFSAFLFTFFFFFFSLKRDLTVFQLLLKYQNSNTCLWLSGAIWLIVISVHKCRKS